MLSGKQNAIEKCAQVEMWAVVYGHVLLGMNQTGYDGERLQLKPH